MKLRSNPALHRRGLLQLRTPSGPSTRSWRRRTGSIGRFDRSGTGGSDYSRQFCMQRVEGRSRVAVISVSASMTMRRSTKILLGGSARRLRMVASHGAAAVPSAGRALLRPGKRPGERPADERVEGRANKNEGLPPSVSDNGNRAYDRMIPRRSMMYSDRKRGPDGRQGFVQPGGRIDRPSACWKSLRPQVREKAVKPSRDQARI